MSVRVNRVSSGEPAARLAKRGWNSRTRSTAPGSPSRTRRWRVLDRLRSCSTLGSRGSERTGTVASFRSRLLSASPGSKGGSVVHELTHRWAWPFARTACARWRCPRPWRGVARSGGEVVEEAVEGLAAGVGLPAVGVEEEILEAGAVVAGDGAGGDGEVPPTVGDAELAEVHVAGDLSVGEQGVGWAVVAVADDRVLVVGVESFELRQGSVEVEVAVVVVEVLGGSMC